MTLNQQQSTVLIDPLPRPHAARRAPTGPIFSSIGTVLVDCFDLPPLPSLASQTPANTCPPSPTARSSRSLSSSFSSLSFTTAQSSGSLTPQRSFASDDTTPSGSEQSSITSAATSLSQIEEEPVEILGGGALYCLVGARMWLPPSECRALVDTDDERRDLSKDQEEELEGYGAGCWGYLEGQERRMIKARIRYEGTVRLYKHIVPPPHRSFPSLLNTPIDGAHYLHIAPPYNPEDLCRLLAEQRALEAREGKRTWRPKIVYEPAPMGCHSGQKEFLEETLPYIEVISPNHEELMALYGRPLISLSSPLLCPVIEDLITHILNLGVGVNGQGSVVVRCGRSGCVVGTRRQGIRWFPAYWEEEDEGMVKDVTGGGNAYLGGFIAGMAASNGDPYEAALHGTISASFTVEQIGLPLLTDESILSPIPETEETDEGSELEGGDESWVAIRLPKSRSDRQPAPGWELRRPDIADERWNGEVPEWRLAKLRRRIAEQEALESRAAEGQEA